VQIVGDVGHKISWIYATFDNKQVDLQASMIEMEGKIYDRVVSILLILDLNYIYTSPELVNKCCLNKEVHAESWSVHSTTRTKKRVHHWVRVCAFDLNGMPTSAHINVLPLGSYSMILGMDWLYLHRTKVD